MTATTTELEHLSRRERALFDVVRRLGLDVAALEARLVTVERADGRDLSDAILPLRNALAQLPEILAALRASSDEIDRARFGGDR